MIAVPKLLNGVLSDDAEVKKGSSLAHAAGKPDELRDDKEQHNSDMAEERVDYGVKRVGAILHLMAGEYGASRLMDIGRRAAREIEQLGSIAWLDAEIADPVMRYAVLELIKGDILKSDNWEAVEIVNRKLDTLYRKEGMRVRASFNTAEAAFAFSANAKEQADFRRLYYDAIDLNTPLTARYIFNGLTNVVDLDGIDRVIAAMSVALRDDMLEARTSIPRDHLSRMLSYLELFGTARVVQTMVAFARELLSEVDGKDPRALKQRKEDVLSLTKELFALGTSTIPGPVMDKLADNIVGKEKLNRARFFTWLYRQCSQWPVQVWASDDTRNAVHLQLTRRLDQAFNMRSVMYRRF
ncbi:hypothetical protein WT37_04305 [Burkholderia territorii]|nr:hypothetical protein WT37_04305 [Burkholderia territorii]